MNTVDALWQLVIDQLRQEPDTTVLLQWLTLDRHSVTAAQFEDLTTPDLITQRLTSGIAIARKQIGIKKNVTVVCTA